MTQRRKTKSSKNLNTTCKWEFLRRPQKMGMETDLFVKTLSQSDFKPEDVLAREALQNCKDARLKNSSLPAQVRIEKRTLDSNSTMKIAQILKLETCSDRSEFLADQERRKKFTNLLKGNLSLSTLEIADENTIGLGGCWAGNSDSDHFSRLVINLGASLKQEGGGSFGFGKTVFAKQSRLNLVVYYSVFEPTKASKKAHARLMAVWLMKPHSMKGKQYTGFAFLGQPNAKNTNQVLPFIDDEAHKIAEAIGIKKRSSGQLGTSVMIIDCELSMKKTAESIERYWWPSINDNALSVRVVDNGKSIPVNISRNPCVKPYLTTYRRLQTDRPRNDTTKSYDDGTKIKEFRKFGKKKIGWLAIKPLSEVEVDQWKEHEKKRGNDTSAPIGGVARMRPGAGMIISYRTDAISKNKPCIALFQSNDAIEQYLRISEPPAHDNWNSGETRLNDPENFKDEDYEPGLGAKIVRTVNNRITNQLRDFQKDNPDPAPPPDYKLKQLESLLAKLMNAGNQGKPVPAGPPRPFSISVNSKRRKDEGEIKDEADIRITLNDDYPTETLDVEVDITRDLMGVRTTESSIEKLNCAVTDIASGQCYSGEFVTIPATLKKNKPVKLKAVGAGWTFFKTRFQAVVRNTKTR